MAATHSMGLHRVCPADCGSGPGLGPHILTHEKECQSLSKRLP